MKQWALLVGLVTFFFVGSAILFFELDCPRTVEKYHRITLQKAGENAKDIRFDWNAPARFVTEGEDWLCEFLVGEQSQIYQVTVDGAQVDYEGWQYLFSAVVADHTIVVYAGPLWYYDTYNLRGYGSNGFTIGLDMTGTSWAASHAELEGNYVHSHVPFTPPIGAYPISNRWSRSESKLYLPDWDSMSELEVLSAEIHFTVTDDYSERAWSLLAMYMQDENPDPPVGDSGSGWDDYWVVCHEAASIASVAMDGNDAGTYELELSPGVCLSLAVDLLAQGWVTIGFCSDRDLGHSTPESMVDEYCRMRLEEGTVGPHLAISYRYKVAT